MLDIGEGQVRAQLVPLLWLRGRRTLTIGGTSGTVGLMAQGCTTGPPQECLGALRALSDPTRLQLFRALRQAERCVKDLVATEEIPQPLVSHHLRVLTDAGLVGSRRADGFTFYAVDAAGMRSALDVLSELLDPAHIEPTALPGGNAACCR